MNKELKMEQELAPEKKKFKLSDLGPVAVYSGKKVTKKRQGNLFEVEKPFSGPISQVVSGVYKEEAKKPIFGQLLSVDPFWGALPPSVEVVESMYPKFPNFTKVLDKVLAKSRVYHTAIEKKDMLFKLPHLLLVGPPSAGKTYFMQTLAELTGIPVKVISMTGGVGGASGLVGTNSSYKNATVGGIAEILASKRVVNSLVLLDELDKVKEDSGIFEVLHTLLEPKTAATMTDEYLGNSIQIDASNIIFIATANDLRPIPESLLSRMIVVQIRSIPKENLSVIFAEMLRGEVLKKAQLEGRVDILTEGVNYTEGEDPDLRSDKVIIVKKEVIELFMDAEYLRRVRDVLVDKVTDIAGLYLLSGKEAVVYMDIGAFDEQDLTLMGISFKEKEKE